uniref:Activator of HSP90 ATPase activity 1 n=1 Tax=Maylandia zebra TaxID=106582 RepID=A0A3P9AZZ4_9CICH
MAKWGEGDPRWIVEERADATNVNNWHWTERDATNWSSDKLKSLLLGLSVENEEGTCEVTEVSKVEGEASINNRKGKLIFFYEWNVKATWTGKSKAGVEYKGTIEVPNLSDENDMEDLDISVSLNKDEPDTLLMNLMKTKGVDKFRDALQSYVGFLKTGELTNSKFLPEPNYFYACVEQISSSASTATPVNTGVKIPTCKFTLKETFLTSPAELYRVFLNREMVQAFTRGSATVDGEKGGKFRLLDGNILGEFTELVIKSMDLFFFFATEHYATITMTFLDRSSETELKVEYRGVPNSQEEQTKEGWKRYYFESIKQTFGYGARLF